MNSFENRLFRGTTAALVSAASALVLTACSKSQDFEVAHCYAQMVTIADSTTQGAIDRGLEASRLKYGLEAPTIRGVDETGKALDNTMGFILRKNAPQNPDVMDSSAIGWCRIDTNNGESTTGIRVEPLYTSFQSFSIDALKASYTEKKMPDMVALLAKLTPGDHTAVAFPSEAKSPVKKPASLRKAIKNSDTIVEIISPVTMQVAVINDKLTPIWTADLATAKFEPVG